VAARHRHSCEEWVASEAKRGERKSSGDRAGNTEDGMEDGWEKI
jgi:hypothetical protein